MCVYIDSVPLRLFALSALFLNTPPDNPNHDTNILIEVYQRITIQAFKIMAQTERLIQYNFTSISVSVMKSVGVSIRTATRSEVTG